MDQSNSDLNACQKLSQKLGENITKCQNNIYVRKKISLAPKLLLFCDRIFKPQFCKGFGGITIRQSGNYF